jgi:lipid-A-disaccharide synthase
MTTSKISNSALRVAVVAGETSGDVLGAGLISAIRERVPNAEFFGMAGERMRAAGCDPWYRAEEVSVMGLAEVLRHLPRLLSLRRRLAERIRKQRPDVFVGIDSPDFNLPVAAALKAAGIPTVQYVSPQVWAWRQWRVAGIRNAIDLVLCVLPFETDFYAQHGVRAQFVGHPLADAIPPQTDRAAAKRALGFGARPLVALLPGSRRGEVSRLARPFLETAAWLQRRREIDIAVALAGDAVAAEFSAATAGIELSAPARLFTGRAREVMTAADAVLTASGTASLEAMLLKRPMVVAYRVAPLTYWIWRRMGVARLPHFSLPNLLARRGLVAEFVQGQVCAEALGPAMLDCLDGRVPDPDWRSKFDQIHAQLRQGGDGSAADAVLDLLRAHEAAR